MEAISIQNLGKSYLVSGHGVGSVSIKEYMQKIIMFKMPKKVEFWGLRNVDLQISEGDVIGLIGHNGSGKTTLLKLLSQVTEPSEGEIRIRGSIGALLGANTGFHEELNSIENIYLSSAIMGFSKKDVDRVVEEIVAFSGLSDFIYEPIKHLSSGMQMKLGLSTVMLLMPDIFILDEVVGKLDVGFRGDIQSFITKKIFGKKTAIIVNHDSDFIKSNCNVIIELENGRCKNINRNRI
jgi:ABC-type polysaccharide/polyol phosphate transport system ATPase subunit